MSFYIYIYIEHQQLSNFTPTGQFAHEDLKKVYTQIVHMLESVYVYM